MKKIFYLLLLVIVIVFPIYNKNSIMNFSSRNSTIMYNKTIEKIYDANFILSKIPVGNMNHYLPLYIVRNSEDALYYSSAFDITQNFHETDEHYIYENNDEKLYIYKFGGLVNYKKDYQSDTNKVITDEDAIKLAQSFIEDKFLKLNFIETNITHKNKTIVVSFINHLANVENYSFITEVEMANDGTVIELDYYDIKFEKLTNTKIKPMYDAYYELPLDEQNSEFVDLKKCSLVYFFENSIVQPAYLFEGETISGDSFKCFIKASVYN